MHRPWRYLLLPLLWPASALAVDYGGPRIETYPVGGNAAEVLRAMLAALPATGGEHFATTTWVLHYDLTSQPQGDACAVGGVRVSLTVTTRLPQLDPDHSDLAVKTRWGDFSAALRTHEQGHQRIAEEGAQQLEDELRGLGTADSCPALERRASERFADVSHAIQQRQQAYDQGTGNGRSQGAVFP